MCKKKEKKQCLQKKENNECRRLFLTNGDKCVMLHRH